MATKKYKRLKNNDDYASWDGPQSTTQTIIGRAVGRPEFVLITIGDHDDQKHDEAESALLRHLNEAR